MPSRKENSLANGKQKKKKKKKNEAKEKKKKENKFFFLFFDQTCFFGLWISIHFCSSIFPLIPVFLFFISMFYYVVCLFVCFKPSPFFLSFGLFFFLSFHFSIFSCFRLYPYFLTLSGFCLFVCLFRFCFFLSFFLLIDFF